MSKYRWTPSFCPHPKSEAGFYAQQCINFIQSSICKWKINHTALHRTTPCSTTWKRHTHTQYTHCSCTFGKKIIAGQRLNYSRMGWSKRMCQVNGKPTVNKWWRKRWKKVSTSYELQAWMRRKEEKRDPQQSFKCTVTLLIAIMRTFYMCLYTNSDKMLFTSRCDLMLPECEE